MANQVHGPEGMIFANKYRIVRLIGSGGMANVYLGIDMNTGVNVAIKILKPEFSSDEDFIRRFDAEAKSVASLKSVGNNSDKEIFVLPYDYFSPKSYVTGKIEKTNNTYSIHHFAGTWLPWYCRMEKKICSILGLKYRDFLHRHFAK